MSRCWTVSEEGRREGRARFVDGDEHGADAGADADASASSSATHKGATPSSAPHVPHKVLCTSTHTANKHSISSLPRTDRAATVPPRAREAEGERPSFLIAGEAGMLRALARAQLRLGTGGACSGASCLARLRSPARSCRRAKGARPPRLIPSPLAADARTVPHAHTPLTIPTTTPKSTNPQQTNHRSSSSGGGGSSRSTISSGNISSSSRTSINSSGGGIRAPRHR